METLKIYLTAFTILFLTFSTIFSETEQVFFDDFETSQGWVRNAFGTDDATTGLWDRDNPEETVYSVTMQLGTTISGTKCLVTNYLAGSYPGEYDIDGGKTTVRSPDINLPSDGDIVLSFSFFMGHYYNATSEDYLRVKIVGSTTQVVFEELGSADLDEAVWETFSVSLNNFSGQKINILIEAADNGAPSLVEAGIEDVLIEKESFAPPGIHDSNWVLVGNDIENTNSGAVKVKKDLIIGDGTTQEYSEFTGGSFFINSGGGESVTLEEGRLSFISGTNSTTIYPGEIDASLIITDRIHSKSGGPLFLTGETQVDGELWARKVTVTLDAFPDFVFTPTHRLKSLEETEKFIEKHGRLPGMPSEKEVKENGLDIGAMQSKLLEKIEEMTLLMISLDKKNKALETKVNVLREQIENK